MGFYINAISLKGIYEDLVKNGPLDEFYTMQLCQDHLETTYSLIRNACGSNDNPNPIEFMSTIRKLFVCNLLITSKDHNCISNATRILTMPSTKKPTKSCSDRLDEKEIKLTYRCDYESTIIGELKTMEKYDEHLFAYVALEIEKKIIRKIELECKLSCSTCASVFEENLKFPDELLLLKNEEPSRADLP